MKKKTEQKYLPKVVLARLKTATTMEKVQKELKGKGFTRNEMKAMARCYNFFDGLEVYLSKWNWDSHEKWHLYSWDDEIDETVMKAVYEAEQFHRFSCGRYKNNFEQFKEDWEAETDEQVEVLEVLQEEVNNIDPEEVQREVRKAEDTKRDRQRKRRMKASKGSRYRKKYF